MKKVSKEIIGVADLTRASGKCSKKRKSELTQFDKTGNDTTGGGGGIAKWGTV